MFPPGLRRVRSLPERGERSAYGTIQFGPDLVRRRTSQSDELCSRVRGVVYEKGRGGLVELREATRENLLGNRQEGTHEQKVRKDKGSHAGRKRYIQGYRPGA
jgi:hypothetical protein